MEPEGEPGSSDPRNQQQVDNAIRAIQEKKPIPEIDFTMHTMEDGTQVNTQERVCKGAFKNPLPHHHHVSATRQRSAPETSYQRPWLV